MNRTATAIAAFCRAVIRRVCTPVGERWAVVLLLATQAGLLGYSATQHSPTFLEPAILASGISHWKFGRFEPYRVNPPLVRMVAALPVMAIGCKTDWDRFHEYPGSRAEFALGEDFIHANGRRSLYLICLARWACIPFSLAGSYFTYRWAKELYGGGAGVFSLVLYICEPNLLAHGELITSDAACTAFFIIAAYTYWQWLRSPTWTRATLAGGGLGIAQLAKTSSLILIGLWPVLWILWNTLKPRTQQLLQQPASNSRDPHIPPASFHTSATSHYFQFATIIIIPLYIINIGYGFDGFGVRLKDYTFVSSMLTGLNNPGESGNRFRQTLAGQIPVPLPRQYIMGLDIQKRDFEDFGEPSYLRGEWRDGGWWYYYLYGLSVKVPAGTLGLMAIAALQRFADSDGRARLRDELPVFLPAASLLILVSSQTQFNQHLRYVFPSLGMVLVAVGQVSPRVFWDTGSEYPFCYRRFTFDNWNTYHTRTYNVWHRLKDTCVFAFLASSIASSLAVYPQHLAYFNELAGGPRNGWRHLLGSSFDWGQDLLSVSSALRARSNSAVSVDWAIRLTYDPTDLDLPRQIEEAESLAPSAIIVSRSVLAGTEMKRPSAAGMFTISQFLSKHGISGNIDGYDTNEVALTTLVLIHADRTDSMHSPQE